MSSLKQGIRALSRSPGFVTVSLALLTAGIAANLSVFGTLDALFLRPVPVQRPEGLAQIISLSKDGHAGALPSTILTALRNRREFESVCGMDTFFQAAEVAGSVRQIGEAAFSGRCFETLGLRLELGRGIAAADDQPNAAPVAVITDSLWKEAFASRPDVLGQAIRLEDKLYTIVGVTQKGFTGLLLGFPEPVMIPLHQNPQLAPDGRQATYWWVNVLARLTPGVSLSQARGAIQAEQVGLLFESVPPHYDARRRRSFLEMKLELRSARNGLDYFLRDRFGLYVYAIFGLCLTVLLLTCVNMVNLLLARSLRRRQEVAVRLALGATRGHIARILLLENALLLAGGTFLGVLAGSWIGQIILANWGKMFGNFQLPAGFDARVVFFVVATVLAVFGIFTVASIWQAGRLTNAGALKQNGRGIIGRDTAAQRTLLVAQIAVTLALVWSAGLFGASVKNMYRINFGIRPQNVWSVLLVPRPGGYRNFEPGAYYRNLIAQIEQLPGVVSVSICRDIPFLHSVDKDPVEPVDTRLRTGEIAADVREVTDDYFATLGAKIETGEDFRRTDNAHTGMQIIVSKSLAERLGGSRELIGHHLRIGADSKYQRARIIAVASNMDMNLANLDDQRPFTVFVNLWQDRDEQRFPVVLIKTAGNQLDAAALRRIVNQGGREFVERITTISGEIDNALIENRFLAYLAGMFGAIALTIAGVGLFGLVSYQVSSRTSEVGVRMAVGAQLPQIGWLFLREIAVILAGGAFLGIAMTFALRRLLATLLFGVGSYDPAVITGSALLLAVTGIAAVWAPLRRAMKVEPAEALKCE